MATTTEQSSSRTTGSFGSEVTAELREPPSSKTGRRIGLVLIGLLVLAALAGLVAVALPQINSFSGSGDPLGAITHVVKRSTLRISVTEDGNIESAENVDVKCRVKKGSTILWIIQDGSHVKKGEKIIELDPAPIDDLLTQQQITVANARAAFLQAEQQYQAADIAVEEYEKGTYVQQRKDLEAAVEIAKQNLNSAEDLLTYTELLYRKGFASDLDLQAKRAGARTAQLNLESAQTALEVLDKYTRRKTLTELTSTRDQASAQKDAAKATLDLEEGRLKELQQQLKNCTINAPQGGMVVYANEENRRGPEIQIEEGAQVREQQTIVRIPDLSRMQVKVNVHESKVEMIKPGMPATVRIQDRIFKGVVEAVANQPEPSSWFSANIKEYATIVKIDGGADGLKPGMTAEVEIRVAELPDVLTVPVQAVVEQRGAFYSWVETSGEPQRRKVVLGQTNDKLIEIKDGLLEGDEVLLNPRALLKEAREEGPAAEAEGTHDQQGEQGGNQAGPSASDEAPSGPGHRPDGSSVGPPGNERSKTGRSRKSATGSGGRPNPAQILKQLDKDGDGKLSRDEAPSRMRDNFDQIDADKDGFISGSELGEMFRRFSQRARGAQGAKSETPSPANGRPGGP